MSLGKELQGLDQKKATSVSKGPKGQTLFTRSNKLFLSDPVGIDFFSPSHWHGKGCLVSEAQGRGNTYSFLYQQYHFFLRHYQRGGLFGPLLGDYYLWTGLQNTRAWREFDLLTDMAASGLPVPRPVAARVTHTRGLYKADIVTECIPKASTLADLLLQGAVDEPTWKNIGCCIHHFHDHEIFHADLNVRNILIDSSKKVWLIDFDRSFQGKLGWRQKKSNLRRLLRSLRKVWPKEDDAQDLVRAWNCLLLGYAGHDRARHSPCL
jgi:3-deoxy-D-manno-octulosonic acid kinase